MYNKTTDLDSTGLISDVVDSLNDLPVNDRSWYRISCDVTRERDRRTDGHYER